MFRYNDLTVLAGTLYGEVRGCSDQERENVAQVILNRYHTGWGLSIQKVCLAPWQFSCWNAKDVNREKILTAAQKDPKTWTEMLNIASSALSGTNPDRVNGADSYYAKSMKKAPFWATAPAVKTFEDGAHIFWRVRRK